jgi:hypothetical protein
MADKHILVKHNGPEASESDESNSHEISQEELSNVTGGLATISIVGGDGGSASLTWTMNGECLDRAFNSPDSLDKIVRRLDDFPELAQALRDGNQVSARLLFAQLFDIESDQTEPRREAHSAAF